MTLRRLLLTEGGNAMVGNLSRYETKSMTFPLAGNNNSPVVIPVSFMPKILIISGGTDTLGNVIGGVYMFDDQGDKRAGGTMYRNKANSNLVSSGLVTAILSVAPANAVNQCYYYNGSVYVSRPGSNGWFSNTDTYTIEIYA